jgi:DNA-binding transcriptional MerR regulator
MTIGQVARKAGVTQSAIRYYESSGLLPRPSRKHGARQYDDDAVDQVKVLRFFRRAGISIRGLAIITSKDRGSKTRRDVVLDVLQRRITDLDALMIEVQETKRRLEDAIACECNGDLKVCPILPADEDAAIL